MKVRIAPKEVSVRKVTNLYFCFLLSVFLDKIETALPDGSKETRYTNGNVKVTSPDGNVIKTKYYNGDIKETDLLKGQIKYFYFETNTWQTTFADGTEILEFPK